MGGYIGLYGLFKLVSGGKKVDTLFEHIDLICIFLHFILCCDVAQAAPAVAAEGKVFAGAFPPSGYKSGVEPGAASIPSFTDDGFDAWSKVQLGDILVEGVLGGGGRTLCFVFHSPPSPPPFPQPKSTPFYHFLLFFSFPPLSLHLTLFSPSISNYRSLETWLNGRLRLPRCNCVVF